MTEWWGGLVVAGQISLGIIALTKLLDHLEAEP